MKVRASSISSTLMNGPDVEGPSPDVAAVDEVEGAGGFIGQDLPCQTPVLGLLSLLFCIWKKITAQAQQVGVFI